MMKPSKRNVSPLAAFEELLTPLSRRKFQTLSSPPLLQAYLDSLPYIAEERDRSPLQLLADRQAHCLDGAIFAALALHKQGHPPLVLDLVPARGQDDDHVLALFKYRGRWGSIAKSNYAGQSS